MKSQVLWSSDQEVYKINPVSIPAWVGDCLTNLHTQAYIETPNWTQCGLILCIINIIHKIVKGIGEQAMEIGCGKKLEMN